MDRRARARSAPGERRPLASFGCRKNAPIATRPSSVSPTTGEGWKLTHLQRRRGPHRRDALIRHGGSMPSIVIAQGGGPTAVINQTLCGAILAARRHDPSVRILGARYGVRGLMAGHVVDPTTLPAAQLRRLRNTTQSCLRSTPA